MIDSLQLFTQPAIRYFGSIEDYSRTVEKCIGRGPRHIHCGQYCLHQ